MSTIRSVRCGSLALVKREPREFFGGACVSTNSYLTRASVCPRQGPRPTEVLAGFCFWRLLDWTTLPAGTAANGTRGLMSFGVMRSLVRCGSKARRRIASLAPLDRPSRCTDAVAPGSRDAKLNPV